MGDSTLNTGAPNSEDNNDDNNDAITMVDVLEEQTELEEDANAVLGASDAKNCTYPEGYVKRQALYACLTCLPENGDDVKLAGVCLACSYFCHEKHNLIELYTKRNFRCDCGNSLFGDKKCALQEDKDVVNVKNKYNHNFRGTYCTCDRPYPDLDDEISDAMIQCIICEDWYHCRHLGSTIPAHDEYGEMICKSCMAEHKFLEKYSGLCVTKVTSDKSENTAPLAVNSPAKCAGESATSEANSSGLASGSSEKQEDANPVTKTTAENCETGVGNSPSKTAEEVVAAGANSSELTSDTPHKQNDSNHVTKTTVENDETAVSTNGSSLPNESEETSTKNAKECSLAKMKNVEVPLEGATFWPDNWRNHLCTCLDCEALYTDEGVAFLLDQQDTVHAYEERGKKQNGGETQYDKAMDALQQMDRADQIEAILGYNDMKDSLKEYLRTFAERKRVVREEDIREFFNTMQARKRQRLELPHNCR